jgi:hypothetical protein
MDAATNSRFYRFSLDFGFSAAHCRVMDATPLGWLPMLYALVYHPIHTVDGLAEHSTIPYFLNPIHIYAQPNVRGKGAWKELVHVRDDRPFSLPDKKGQGLDAAHWHVVRGDVTGDSSSRIQGVKHYGQVAHLEEDFIIYPRSVVIRTTLEWMKLKGIDPGQHYDLDDPHVEHVYRQSIRMPLLEMIPATYRNRCLSEAELVRLTNGNADLPPFR